MSAKIQRIIEKTLMNYGYVFEEPAPIIRDLKEKPFFTFSPLLNVQENFTNSGNIKKLSVKQLCMRNIDTRKVLFDPLATEMQLLYGVYSFEMLKISHYFSMISEILIDNFKLDKEKIYIVLNKDNNVLKEMVATLKFNILEADPKQLVCNIPGIENTHYIKILYKYKDGVLPLVNFVLIDQEGVFSKLDGIIFYERLLFVLESKNSIFETNLYKQLRDKIKILFGNMNENEVNMVSLAIRSSIALMMLGLEPSPKLAGYSVRKNLRDVFSFLSSKNLKLSLSDVREIVEVCISTMKFYDSFFLTEITEEHIYKTIYSEYNSYIYNVDQKIDKIRNYLLGWNKNEIVCEKEIDQIKATYGVSIYHIKVICQELGLQCEDNLYKKYITHIETRPYTYSEIKRSFNVNTWFETARKYVRSF